MNIQIEPHTLERAKERGANKSEIFEVIKNGNPILAKSGRLGRSLIFDYGKKWSGKHYEQKRIDVFYIIENDKIITVTVYVFYGKWGE